MGRRPETVSRSLLLHSHLPPPPYPFTISKMSRDAHPLSWDFLSLKGSRKVPMLALCVEPVYHLPPQGLGLSRFPRPLDHASPGCDFLVRVISVFLGFP